MSVRDDFQKRLRHLPTGPDCREMSGNVGKCVGKCREMSGNVGKCWEMSGNVGDASGGGPVKATISPKVVLPPYARVVPALALFQVFCFLAHESDGLHTHGGVHDLCWLPILPSRHVARGSTFPRNATAGPVLKTRTPSGVLPIS